MLNEVLIEGFVSGRSWTYSSEQYFRLACYRDRHRPPRRKENRDEPDYVTVRLQANGLPVSLQPGLKVRVQGYLQSRYFDESLDDWLKNVHGPAAQLTAGADLRRELKHPRVVNEVVCERLTLLPGREPREGAEERPPRGERAPAPEKTPEAQPQPPA